MAGHSKFKNIMHRKGRQDAKRAKVFAKLGKEPVIHPYIDEAMIGGLKLRIGDQLIDGSVQTKLRRISDQIQTSGSKAIRERVESYMEETN